MLNHYRELVFISAELSRLTPEINKRRTEALLNMLNDLGANFELVGGIYKGQRENSFMVFLDHNVNLEIIEGFARNFDQECIFYRDKYNKNYLVYENDVEELKGELQKITPLKASRVTASTYIPSLNEFWAVI